MLAIERHRHTSGRHGTLFEGPLAARYHGGVVENTLASMPAAQQPTSRVERGMRAILKPAGVSVNILSCHHYIIMQLRRHGRWSPRMLFPARDDG